METSGPGSDGGKPWRGETPREHRGRRKVNPERRTTDYVEAPGLEVGRRGNGGGSSEELWTCSPRMAGSSTRNGGRKNRGADGKKVAGVERRYGFGVREKL